MSCCTYSETATEAYC